MDDENTKKKNSPLRDVIEQRLLESLTSPANSSASAEAVLSRRLASVKDGGTRPMARSRSEYDRQVRNIREQTYNEFGVSDPLRKSMYSGAYTDAELKNKGANKLGYDWSKTDDPLRGSRLDKKAGQKENSLATPTTGGERTSLTFPASNATAGPTSQTAVSNGGGSESPTSASKIADGLRNARAERMGQMGVAPASRGMITEINSGVDGQVLARRGEGDARVASGGTQGAMGGTVDVPGKLELTQAGENAIRDRLTVNKTPDGATTVTGRYGTAIGGVSTKDQLKEVAPQSFEKARTALLETAGQTAKKDGDVVGDAKPLLDRMAPGARTQEELNAMQEFLKRGLLAKR